MANKTKQFLILFLVALLVRIIAIELFHFDGLYGQDPYAYYNYSLELREAFGQLQPPPPFFWPIGYPLLVVLGTLVTGVRPLAGQLVSMVAGALIAPLVFLLVCEIKPSAKVGAMAAGLLAAVAGQLMLTSTALMSDATALAWVTLSAWAMLRYTRDLRPGWLILSAFALSWAILTRWAAILVALPWALSAFLAWSAASWPWRRAVIAAGIAILAGGLLLSISFIPSLARGELTHVGDLQVVRWNPANAFKNTISNSDGLQRYERPVALFYAQPVVDSAFIFPLLTPFLILGLWSLRDRSRPHAALLLGWPLIVYLFLAGIAWENPRFSLAMFPPLTALVGLGFQFAWDWSTVPVGIKQGQPGNASSPEGSALPNNERKLSWTTQAKSKYPRLLRYWRPFLVGWCALALVGSLNWSLNNLRDFTSKNQANISAALWVVKQVPAEATVITFGVTQTMEHRTELDIEEIYLLDEAYLSKLLATQLPIFLFLNLDHIESQWLGKSPHLNYQWLRENTIMREIGRYPPYTLYYIEV